MRGQYVGYRDEPGVAPDSTIETFVAAKLEIDSWRWAGVPWYVRAGKRMPGGATEAVVELRRPPRLLFAGHEAALPERQPRPLPARPQRRRDVVAAGEDARRAPRRSRSTSSVDFAAALGDRQEAYERLLDDAMDGRRRRFAREDAVEQEWRIVEPVLDLPERPVPYYKGTWGPPSAQPAEGWHGVTLRT